MDAFDIRQNTKYISYHYGIAWAWKPDICKNAILK